MQVMVHGIVGGQILGTINNCINNININTAIGDIYAGAGIAKESGVNANINNCTNKGNIKGVQYVGGIVGGNKGRIENCMSNGEIQGEYLVGGIAGNNINDSSVITDCCNLGSVTSTGSISEGVAPRAFTGGVVGDNYGTVTRSINQATVTSEHRTTGGIAGRNYRNNIILL